MWFAQTVQEGRIVPLPLQSPLLGGFPGDPGLEADKARRGAIGQRGAV